MNAENSLLPWTGAPVRKVDNLCAYLSRNFPSALSELLPRDISMFVDHGVDEDVVFSFLESTSDYLKGELQRRLTRANIFVQLGLISAGEIHTFMTGRTDIQAWALYYSMTGGLGIPNEEVADPNSAESGVIPCSSMRNHGVAWHRTDPKHLDVWLATSRKPCSDWDWDSDIGHESAHASFAQVPLFLQALSKDIDNSHLALIRDTSRLKPGHIARIMYFYSELAVAALRGEQRVTPTGLPVADHDELIALLRLSEQLAPGVGFGLSLDMLRTTCGYIDVNRGTQIYELAYPIIKVIPKLAHFTNMGKPPEVGSFVDALRMPCVV